MSQDVADNLLIVVSHHWRISDRKSLLGELLKSLLTQESQCWVAAFDFSPHARGC